MTGIGPSIQGTLNLLEQQYRDPETKFVVGLVTSPSSGYYVEDIDTPGAEVYFIITPPHFNEKGWYWVWRDQRIEIITTTKSGLVSVGYAHSDDIMIKKIQTAIANYSKTLGNI